MLFNKNDMYIGRSLDLYGEWAWPELEATQKFAVGQVIDIGANIGTHTLVYAKTASQVIAVEPQFIVFQTLMANLALNCLENVIPHFGAMGDRDGTTRVLRPDYTVEGNFGCVTTGDDGQQIVCLTRLDTLKFQPDFIKLDAEGDEVAILEGARETIRKYRPVLYVENNQDNPNILIDMIKSFGYDVYWHKPPLYQSDNFYGNAYNEFSDTVSENILCIPERRSYAIEKGLFKENHH